MTFRIYATCDIGSEALDRLRQKGWQLEVYDKVEPPPKELILEKVRSGIDALIMGMYIAALAPVGDLFESMVKRDLEIKDTGRAFGPCSWEIYGDWTDDTTKLETQVIYLLS